MVQLGGAKVDWLLIALLILALLSRVGAIIAFPSLLHPDENFQLFEQGHRWFFGTGIVPWEFRLGTRSPVLPFLLGLTFKTVEPIVGGPEGYIFVTRLLLAVTSMAAVAAVYQMGKRISRAHAFFGGVITATWFELVYFAGRPLTEAVAATVLLITLSLASVFEQDLTRRRVILIGFCLALCLLLRVQFVFGLLTAAAWVGRLHFERWWWMAVGALPPLIVFGVADTIIWGGFFHSYIEATRLNLFEGVASHFGTEPFGWYFYQLTERWSYAFPIFILLIILRGRSSMLWILVALAILLTHSLIPHKEYRFVFAASACLVVVAALASADLIQRLREGWPQAALLATGAIGTLWVLGSLALAYTSKFSYEWYLARDLIRAEFLLAKAPNLCGILLYDYDWWQTGGYAYLHRDVPFYKTNERGVESLTMVASAFDAVLLKRSSVSDMPKDYITLRCWGTGKPHDVCVMMREKGCDRVPQLQAITRPVGVL